jgi:L-lysine epsilon oxidase-like protein
MTTTLRIHPAIGISRVGNSPEFILSPESSAGMPAADGSSVSGGLPIRPGTEAQNITDQDLRDSEGRLKPHAQRFRIFLPIMRIPPATPIPARSRKSA